MQYGYFFGGYVAEYPDCQSGAGEGMPVYQHVFHSELLPYSSYFVLEEEAQRLAELEVHFFGQPAYVMVAFYYGSGYRERFYAVGVYGALCQPLGVFYLFGFLFEYVDEAFAYYLAFLFGVGYSGQFSVELVFCIDAYYVEAERFVIAHHVFELVFAQ